MQQHEYTAIQNQARLALLAAQLQQQQDKHSQDQYYKQQQQTIQQQQQRLFALSNQQQQQQQQQQLPVSQPQQSVERERLAAQVQANLLARTTRQKNLDDAETRARFESIPNTPTNLRSPFGADNTARVSPFARPDSMWGAGPTATKTSTTTGKGENAPISFSQFRSQATIPSVQQQPSTQTTQVKPSQGLSALLARRGQVQAPITTKDNSVDEVYSTESSRATLISTTALATPTSLLSDKDTDEKTEPTNTIKALGLGRPAHLSQRPVRAWSTPSGASTAISTPIPTPRSASQPLTTAVHAIRQPFGPPGNIDKLKEENFKSM